MSLDDPNAPPEPETRSSVPLIVWLMVGLVVVVAFATIVALRGGHIEPRAVGPPAGAPAGDRAP